MISVRPLIKGDFQTNLLGKFKIPQATPVLANKKRGTRCTNRRRRSKK
jgi:hypothetical protein